MLRALITTDVLLACFYIPGLLAIVSVVSSIPCSLGVRQMALTMDGWMDGWVCLYNYRGSVYSTVCLVLVYAHWFYMALSIGTELCFSMQKLKREASNLSFDGALMETCTVRGENDWGRLSISYLCRLDSMVLASIDHTLGYQICILVVAGQGWR